MVKSHGSGPRDRKRQKNAADILKRQEKREERLARRRAPRPPEDPDPGVDLPE